MLGWLLNTLSYRLRRELREWRKTNNTLKKYAWPWYQRILVNAGNNPVRVPFGLFWAVLLLSGATWAYHAYYAPAIHNPLYSHSISDQHFFALWTIQATIAAMVYPIVIGFVTLLLQRRHSAKASLQIYLHDSTAILTGLSALFLVMAMGIQYFFITMIGKQVLSNWLILDGVWFLINSVGVIRFLVRTFDYLRPEQRANIVRAYAINLIWPAELRRNVEYNLFTGAIGYGWLPGPSFGSEGKNSGTAILMHSLGQDKGDVQVTDQKKDKWFIHDVRLRPLSWAIRSWQRREEKRAFLQKDEMDAFAGVNSRLLVLPSAPGAQFDAKYGLCRTEGGTALHWWEQWLVRQSFVLSRKEKKEAALSISDILNGLITETQVAMEATEEVAFREALEELVDTQATLIRAGDFVADTGQRDNYVNLESRDHVFGEQMHVLWLREYRRLIETAVEKLPTSDTYFKSMVHLPGWLIDRAKEARPISIAGHQLQLSRSIHYCLNSWWSQTVEEQGLLNHGSCEPATLRAPGFAIYDGAIKAYVGAWESLKNNRFPPEYNEAMTWEQYGEIGELYTVHLDSTLYMLFSSLTIGNKEGAEWLCDSLIKWWDTSRFQFDNTRYYIRDDRKLTIKLLRKPWDEVKEVIDLSGLGSNVADAPKSLWSACLRNYWADLCCISLYAIIQFGKTCECERSLPAQLAKNLGRGEPLRAGGASVGGHWPIQMFEDLLITLMRQHYFDGGHQGYRSRLDRVIEGIFSQGKPSWVPGRLYSGTGSEELESLRDGQLLLLCLLIKEDWTPSARFMEMIQKWGGEDDAGLRRFNEQLGHWKTRLSDTGFREYENLFSCIRDNFGAVENFKAATDALQNGLGQLSSGIESFRDEQLKDKQISEDRLGEIAVWSSRSGFKKDSGDIPVSLFKNVRHFREEYKEYSLTIREMNKGEFVEPLMEQRASNEQEWFERTISNHVAGYVMAETLRCLVPETINLDGPVAYWEQIQNAASMIRQEGGTPILLIAGQADPDWLFDWTISGYEEGIKRPAGLRLVREKQFDTSDYVFSLNDIPVFVAPVSAGSSFLISQEALDTLSFTEFEDDVFVRASVEPIQGKDMLINLKLTWRFKLDLNPGKCWRLRYIQSGAS